MYYVQNTALKSNYDEIGYFDDKKEIIEYLKEYEKKRLKRLL